MTDINGDDLIAWGFKPGKGFRDLIAQAQQFRASGYGDDYIIETLKASLPPPQETVSLRTNSIPFKVFLEPEDEDEQKNLDAVIRHMDAIVRLPSVTNAAIMPDSMPAGSQLGTIPVGGVVVTDGTIHPGMHSADICCSMAITVFKRDEDVARVLDEAMKVTHFGYGKRSKSEVRQHHNLKDLIARFEGNRFMDSDGMRDAAENHFMTQGDGNHFLYVGHLESTGELALVTHHGSRSLGGLLYKYGMAAAKKHTAIHAPRVPDHQAWLDFNTEAGEHYWDALQLIRDWTKLNHYAIHDDIAKRLGNKVVDRFWNEHNFVFLKDEKFYHAKGATPSYDGFSPDDDGRTLIPMNMSEPILIAEHANSEDSLFFAPHGAGRNFSRTEHERRLAEEFGENLRELSDETKATILKRETADKGVDARFYVGKPDLSELPSSYKSAKQVTSQIEKHGLAKVVDKILPGGTIMAGELEQPWRNKKK